MRSDVRPKCRCGLPDRSLFLCERTRARGARTQRKSGRENRQNRYERTRLVTGACADSVASAKAGASLARGALERLGQLISHSQKEAGDAYEAAKFKTPSAAAERAAWPSLDLCRYRRTAGRLCRRVLNHKGRRAGRCLQRDSAEARRRHFRDLSRRRHPLKAVSTGVVRSVTRPTHLPYRLAN